MTGHRKNDDGRFVRGEATRERVLDAAERLFAEHGFDAVSIRQIAQEAGVTLGVVGFHSGSKEQLFSTVLSRRVELLSEGRLRALAALIANRESKTITTRDLVAAYIEPYINFALAGDIQWLAYARLIARIAADKRFYGLISDHYDPVAREFLIQLQTIYPGTSQQKLAAGLIMSVAAMLSTVASTSRMRSLAQDEFSLPTETDEHLSSYKDMLVSFCAGGIDQIATT